LVGAVGVTENAAQLRFLYVDAPSERGQRERETRGRRQPVAEREADPSNDQQQTGVGGVPDPLVRAGGNDSLVKIDLDGGTKCAARAATAQTRVASPNHITMTPKTRTATGIRSDGATEAAMLAAAIAVPSEMAIRTLVQRSRSRPPLPRTASRTRRPTSSNAQHARAGQAERITVLY
jgi:hypothetical protein